MPASASDFRKRIGRHLQQRRKAAGYKSAKAFAERIGVNPNTYTQYEQGLSGFSYEKAWEIADVLDCTLDELGGREFRPREYSDPRQEALNDHYESLNEESKGDLTAFAKSFAADPERRIEKDEAERPSGSKG